MRLFATLAAVALAATPVIAAAQPAPAAPAAPAAAAPAFSTGKSTLGALLGDPNAKAVLAKYLPDVVGNDQIAQAAGLTLKDLQQYLPNVTDKMLADMDTELAKVPAPKN